VTPGQVTIDLPIEKTLGVGPTRVLMWGSSQTRWQEMVLYSDDQSLPRVVGKWEHRKGAIVWEFYLRFIMVGA